MTQGLRALVALREDPAHMAAHSCPSFQFQRMQCPLQAAGTQMEHTYIGVRGNTYSGLER